MGTAEHGQCKGTNFVPRLHKRSPGRMETRSDTRATVVAGFLGWTLDAFDFFLVVMCLTAIGREFHKPDSEMALATVITLAFRPVGALLFGLLADRYGRRLPLMLDLVFYSMVEVASGLAPTYTA